MKKKIKGKIPNKTHNKSRKKNYYKNKNVLLIPFILMSIAITLMTYIVLGIDFAIIMGLLLLIVILAIAMLNNIKNNKRRRRIISILLIILLTLSIIAVVSFCAFVVYIKSIAEPRFKTSKLNTPEITIIYDKDDKEVTRLGSERREKVKYEELPEVLVDAIIATEDSRFYSHNGFDAPRFARAALGQLAGHDSGGASTLSMQVVKNSFTDAKVKSGIPGIIRKFEDIYLAVYKLEKKYTKEEIIEYYVNNHFLGGNIYGVEEAAEAYFGKDVSDLNLSEAATIAGMFKSPNYYRPNVNPKNATARRSTVLYLMKRHGYITEEEQEIANSIPMESLTRAEDDSSDTIPYQGYIDTVVAEIKDKYGVNPYTTSLKVYTNLDRSKQEGVDNVLNGVTYTWKDDKVQTGVAVLDVETGKVLAVGAGRNRSGLNTWNNATDIKRQPGSSAKPLFDYGPGIEYNDWSTAEMFNDAPYHYSNGRAIHNWDNGYYGNITLRRALSTSRNIPALKAFQQVDNKKIIKFVTSLGIEPEIENGRIHEAHSIGAFTGVNPMQMAAAYSAFSNGGYYNEPYSVRKIEFRLSGRVEEHHSNKKKVMSDATAFMITSVLQDVALTQGGTPNNVAVKTGTTNFDDAYKAAKGLPADAIRDSWAVGYSTKTAIAMWYGYNNVDKVYCLHNFPATYAKDRLFRALVAGAMESNRSQWKQPSSVEKIGGEYYKKGHAPKTPTESSLAAPSNLTVSYNEATQTISLSWGAVKRIADDESFGEFGYKIYRNGTLVGWTTGTSYSISTSTPSGSYRVVAAYKGYSGIEGASATNNFTFKHKNTPEEDCAEKGWTWDGVECKEPSVEPQPTTPETP